MKKFILDRTSAPKPEEVSLPRNFQVKVTPAIVHLLHVSAKDTKDITAVVSELDSELGNMDRGSLRSKLSRFMTRINKAERTLLDPRIHGREVALFWDKPVVSGTPRMPTIAKAPKKKKRRQHQGGQNRPNDLLLLLAHIPHPRDFLFLSTQTKRETSQWRRRWPRSPLATR